MRAVTSSVTREVTSRRIAEALDMRGMSPDVLARRLSTNPQVVQKWVDGGTSPSAMNIRRICRELDVSADWLLGLEER